MISSTGSNAIGRAIFEKRSDGQKFQKGLDGQKSTHIQNKHAKDYFLEENKDPQTRHLCQTPVAIFFLFFKALSEQM